MLLPLWTSVLVRTYAWMVLLGRNGVFNRWLIDGGIISDPLPLLHNFTGVLIGMVHVLLPYMVLPIYGAVRRLDPAIVAAAQGLGASNWRIFWRIYVPLTLNGIFAGSVLVFVLSLGFFITPALLGGGRVIMIAVLIEQQVRETLNWPFAAALSAVLLAFTFAVYALAQRFTRAEGRDMSRRLLAAGLRADLLLPDAAACWWCSRSRSARRPTCSSRRPACPGNGTSAISTIRNGSMPPGAPCISAGRPRCWLWRWACRWPSAWCAASSRAAVLVDRLALAPIIVPTIILSVAVYGLFAKLKLIGAWYGLVVAHTVLALPFVVLVMTAGLRDFDRGLEQAAAGLGASRAGTLLRITLPLLRPSLVSAGLLAFISSFDEVVVALFLAGANMTLPKKMFDNIMMEIDPTIAAVSVMQILLVTLVMVLIGRFGRGLSGSAR